MSTDAERRTQRINQIGDRIAQDFPGKTLHDLGREPGSRDERFRIDDVLSGFQWRFLRMHLGVLTDTDLDPIEMMKEQGTIDLLRVGPRNEYVRLLHPEDEEPSEEPSQ